MAIGRKWNMRFGQPTSSLERMKPPPSKWLVAPRPLRRKSHWAPMPGLRHHFMPGAMETGCVQPCWM